MKIGNIFELGLTPSQIMIAQYLKSNPESGIPEMALYLPMSEKTIRRAIERLLKLGVAEVADIETKGKKLYSICLLYTSDAADE